MAAPTSLRLRIPPDPKYGGYVRERVAAFAADHDIPKNVADEFVTAVAEALANAVEHARSAHIVTSCWIVGDDQLVATVVDDGVGFEPDRIMSEPHLPDPLAERGRGVPIMRKYTDHFAVRSAPGKGTSVTLGRTIRRARSRGASAASG
jgi:stage II sporulation protein AB (anti-sigma F factor)